MTASCRRCCSTHVCVPIAGPLTCPFMVRTLRCKISVHVPPNFCLLATFFHRAIFGIILPFFFINFLGNISILQCIYSILQIFRWIFFLFLCYWIASYRLRLYTFHVDYYGRCVYNFNLSIHFFIGQFYMNYICIPLVVVEN